MVRAIAERFKSRSEDAFDVSEFIERLDPEDVEWLKSRVGKRIQYDEVDRLCADRNLTDTQRRIAEGLRRALIGTPLQLDERVITSKGDEAAAKVDAHTLRTPIAPKGETKEQQTLRATMPRALIGQLDQLEEFVKLLKDFQSPARRSPPLMGLVGDRGHGKDQAIIGYARSLFGNNAQVIEVDLANVTNQDYPRLFGDGGVLSVDNLKVIERNRSGVLRIQGAEDLARRAPRIADGLIQLLTAKRGEPNYARVHYFIDFEAPAESNVRTLIVGALGPAGNRMLSAFSKFKHLDGPAMVEYAKGLLPEILAQDGLSKLMLKYDPDFLEVLGEALATPHAPLDELEARLLRFVLSKFDTETSVRREGSILSLTLAPAFQRSAERKKELLAALHQENPDLFLGAQLFEVEEVGRPGVSDEKRRELLLALQTIHERLTECEAELRPAEPKATPRGASSEALRALLDEMEAIVRYASRNAELRVLELIAPKRAASTSEALERAKEALTALVEPQLKKEADQEEIDRFKKAFYALELVELLERLVDALEQGTFEGAIRIPDEDVATKSRTPPPIRAKQPASIEALQRKLGAPFPPPAVSVHPTDGDAENGWTVMMVNRLPQRDERGPLGMLGTLKLTRDGKLSRELAPLPLDRPGARVMWNIPSGRAIGGVVPEVGKELVVGTRGLGWWTAIPLPDTGEWFHSEQDTSLWHYSADHFDRERLDAGPDLGLTEREREERRRRNQA